MNHTKKSRKNVRLWRCNGWSILAVTQMSGYINCMKELQKNNGKKVRLPEDELQKRIGKLESEE